jgi:chromosome segregation ATPase
VRKSWLVAAILVALAAIALAALAARLTDDDGSSATAWADSVCASLDEWRASIVALTDVSGGLDKASLERKLAAAGDATSQLVSELRDLEAPDLESGDRLERQLEDTAESLRQQVETLETAAEKALAEATTATDLFQSLATLAPQFQALLTSATDAVEALRDADVAADTRAELQRAFADAPACRALRGES